VPARAPGSDLERPNHRNGEGGARISTIERAAVEHCTCLHWIAEFGGNRRERDAVATEQKPADRTARRNTEGKENTGVKTLHRIGGRGRG